MAAPRRLRLTAPACAGSALSAAHPWLSTLIQSMYDAPRRPPTDQPRGGRPPGGAPGDGLRLRQPRPADQPAGGRRAGQHLRPRRGRGAAGAGPTRTAARRAGRPPGRWRGPGGGHRHHAHRGRPAVLPRGRRRRPGHAPAASSARHSGSGPARPSASRFQPSAEPLAAARAAVAALPPTADLVSRLRVAVAAASSADPLRYDTPGGRGAGHRRRAPGHDGGGAAPRRCRGRATPPTFPTAPGRTPPLAAPAVGPAHATRSHDGPPALPGRGAGASWSTTTSRCRPSPRAPPPPPAPIPTRSSRPACRRWRGRCTARRAPWRTTCWASASRRDPRLVVAEHLRAGRALPGFGHRLYPEGDPRAALLLELLGKDPAAAAVVGAVQRLDGGQRAAARTSTWRSPPWPTRRGCPGTQARSSSRSPGRSAGWPTPWRSTTRRRCGSGGRATTAGRGRRNRCRGRPEGSASRRGRRHRCRGSVTAGRSGPGSTEARAQPFGDRPEVAPPGGIHQLVLVAPVRRTADGCTHTEPAVPPPASARLDATTLLRDLDPGTRTRARDGPGGHRLAAGDRLGRRRGRRRLGERPGDRRSTGPGRTLEISRWPQGAPPGTSAVRGSFWRTTWAPRTRADEKSANPNRPRSPRPQRRPRWCHRGAPRSSRRLRHAGRERLPERTTAGTPPGVPAVVRWVWPGVGADPPGPRVRGPRWWRRRRERPRAGAAPPPGAGWLPGAVGCTGAVGVAEGAAGGWVEGWEDGSAVCPPGCPVVDALLGVAVPVGTGEEVAVPPGTDVVGDAVDDGCVVDVASGPLLGAGPAWRTRSRRRGRATSPRCCCWTRGGPSPPRRR